MSLLHLWQSPDLTNQLEVHDWSGRICEACGGTGERDDPQIFRSCYHCGGTGEKHEFVVMGPFVGPVLANPDLRFTHDRERYWREKETLPK